MVPPKLDNIQGDLYSRGFPKKNETYYFFTIVAGKEKEFSQALTALVKAKKISSIKDVFDDRGDIAAKKPDRVPMTNTLIAFSINGLEKVSIPTDTRTIDTDSSRFKRAWAVVDWN
jgi:hypothetical protein